MDDMDDLIVDRAIEIIKQLQKERDDALEQAERWEDDALRLLNERNAAQRERDEARREVCECKCSPPKTPFFGAPQELAEVNGWDCFKENTK
jgi:hypothetical protein